MCREGDRRVGVDDVPMVDRRTFLLGAGCAGLAALVPMAAPAAPSRTRSFTTAQLSQSPIDLRRDDITFVNRLPRIRFDYPRRIDVTLVNTGSPDENKTVRADVPVGAAHLTLSGVRWNLEQFHWHTPSEHELEGRDTPLEMHFVHTDGDDGILVLAVFLDRGKKNRALDPMFRELPELPDAMSFVPNVRLRSLLPEERESLRYSGSLTTPPFTEPVLFVVLAEALSASRRQIRAFQDLFHEGNSRETQPLNGREVLSDAEDVFDDDDCDD
jgi:carbonic anhydrase